MEAHEELFAWPAPIWKFVNGESPRPLFRSRPASRSGNCCAIDRSFRSRFGPERGSRRRRRKRKRRPGSVRANALSPPRVAVAVGGATAVPVRIINAGERRQDRRVRSSLRSCRDPHLAAVARDGRVAALEDALQDKPDFAQHLAAGRDATTSADRVASFRAPSSCSE
jgi:hypothetical protein